MSDVESIIKHFPEEQRNTTRAKATNIITNYIQNPKIHNDKFYNYLLKKTNTFLKNNPDLLITNSDKGNKTVILNKQDYINKSLQLLDDKKFYTKIDSDPTNTFEKKSNDYVKYLQQKEIITSEEAKSLKHITL